MNYLVTSLSRRSETKTDVLCLPRRSETETGALCLSRRNEMKTGGKIFFNTVFCENLRALRESGRALHSQKN